LNHHSMTSECEKPKIDQALKMNFYSNSNSFGKETHTAAYFRPFANMRDLAT
jgi:hypothetical protein